MTARVLVTGGAGFVGSKVIDALASHPGVAHVTSVDLRASRQQGVRDVVMDIRDPGLADAAREDGIDRIVHLAAVVSPRRGDTREDLYSVDVDGTRNVLAAALAAGVGHLTVTSSGAAYGYHPDNPEWIDETDELRGNPEFAYSDHKRLVEEDLRVARESHPHLHQLILRPGTVLGDGLENQITALFRWPFVLGVAGSTTPFVFMWVDDVARVITTGAVERREGIYNLAGTGAVPLRDIAREMGKRFVPLPATLIGGALRVLRRLGVTGYGPEQVDFLRYRPVLSNRRLIEEFGYTPEMSSLEAFRSWRDSFD